MKGIGALQKQRGVKVITGLLEDKNWRIRRAVIESIMIQKRKSREMKDAVLSALKDRNEQVKLAALNAIGKTNDRKYNRYIIQTLEDRSIWVRFRAAKILGDKKAREAVGPLLKLFEKDKGITRVAVARALSHIKDKKALDAMKNGLKTRNEDIKKAIEDALESVRN